MTEKESSFIKLRGGRRPRAGRPAGAPNKLTRPLKELAAQYTEDSIRTLVTLRDHAESEQVRLQAANALLDRGHGRPPQGIDVNAEGPVTITVQRYAPPLPVVVEGQRALEDHAIKEAVRVPRTTPQA